MATVLHVFNPFLRKMRVGKRSEHVIYLVKSHSTRGDGHGMTRLIFKIAIDRISYGCTYPVEQLT